MLRRIEATSDGSYDTPAMSWVFGTAPRHLQRYVRGDFMLRRAPALPLRDGHCIPVLGRPDQRENPLDLLCWWLWSESLVAPLSLTAMTFVMGSGPLEELAEWWLF